MVKEFLHKTKKNLSIKGIKRFFRSRFTVNDSFTEMQKSWLPDKYYLMKKYKLMMHRELNLKNPLSFTEKLNWIKLYDRRPEYTMMVDKYAVRQYIKEKVGEEYLVPLIGVWEKVEDIDFASLPNQFVLKCTHDCGAYICRDKSKIDTEEIKQWLKYHLGRNYYKWQREWPYKNVKRKIICEQFMENTNGDELVDYKFFCFNGEPKLVMLNSNRFGEDGLKTDIYDINWSHMDMSVGHYPQVGDVFNKPKQFDEMVQASKLLSKDIPFVRVDFNVWNQKMYFGELTFFDAAGYEEYHPSEYDRIMGDWLNLPPKKCLIQRKK